MPKRSRNRSTVTIGFVTAILLLAGAVVQFLAVVLPLLFKKI
jgi:hypothetical protein